MALYNYLAKAWKQPDAALWRSRLIDWRAQPATLRVARPTRLDRARALGYRAKPGIIIVRQRVERGGRMREAIRAGRKPKKFRHRKILAMNYQAVAEQRAAQAFPNCEVLNSYYLAQDGHHYWYEIIMLDRAHPQIKHDHYLSWIARPSQKGRVFRGLTSAAKRYRGLRKKGRGTEKMRPSKAGALLRKTGVQAKRQHLHKHPLHREEHSRKI